MVTLGARNFTASLDARHDVAWRWPAYPRPIAQVDAQDVIGGQVLVDALGRLNQATVFADVADVTAETPVGVVASGSAAKPPGSDEATERQRVERRLVPARCNLASTCSSAARR